ncbi:glycoside hydrolase family 43 protein [Zasmidium cellare ATCC 36951]|uniref:Glycoside hydrolase family 43 protein n=1 Tax=Zasmidium cellare ATCC 36951 TaxID=1080233 RepID=A0A6A6D484_ZASCE|nr:glycoside hydrolase family 43 protein [Zasmidium cellare ATCC 36951]KAF2173943.1 glycoside hydrolase family 43 protein [Zasmidium cellare ATCC 36951]
MASITSTLLTSWLFFQQSLAVTNPSGFVLSGGFADPRTTYWQGVYYGFATYKQDRGTEPNVHIPVATSRSFSSGWEYSSAVVLPNGPPWPTTNPYVWDPMLHVYNASHYVLYYAAQSKVNGPNGEIRHCIGTATSTTVLGTYTPATDALMCGAAQGVQYIASYPFTYKGTPYILWKRQTSVQDSQIQVTQLSADGLSLVGSTTTLLAGNNGDYTVEGGAMILNPEADNHPILLYVTGNFENTTYQIEYAVAPTNALIPPSGKQYVPNSKPLIATGTLNGQAVYGPGGPCFPRPYEVQTMMTFMSDPNGEDSNGIDASYINRTMRTANITFGADNTLKIV